MDNSSTPSNKSGATSTVGSSTTPWGSACQQCASAKAKCLRSNSEGKCDRCARLAKDCNPQVHKPRKKRATKPSKTAQLEDRLNGLVDLFRATTSTHNHNHAHLHESINLVSHDVRSTYDRCSCITQDNDLQIAVGAPQSTSGASKRRASSAPDEDGDYDSYDDNGDTETEFDYRTDGSIRIPRHYNSFAPASCMCRLPEGNVRGSSESGERVLALYRAHLAPLFPFVVIPPRSTAKELETARPFLFAVIRMVTSLDSMQSMRAQMCRLIRHVSERMLMQSERSLDLLQGIIVMIGWYHYHCLMHAQLNNLISLAKSLVADLGLNRHPKMQERISLMVLYPDEPSPRTNEERRALLAVWYLSSCISLAFGKIEPMRYSPYLQQCLRDLQESREYESDVALVSMIQIQHLSERISDVSVREGSTEAIPGVPSAPAAAYMSIFQAELSKIQSSLGRSLKNNKYLQVYIHSTAIRLCEPPLIDANLLATFRQGLASFDHSRPSALDLLYRSSNGIKDWFNHWFTIPVSSYAHLPLPLCCQLIYAVTMLARWAKLVSSANSSPKSQIGQPYVPPDQEHSPTGADSTSIAAPTTKLPRRKDPNRSFPPGLGPPPSFDEFMATPGYPQHLHMSEPERSQSPGMLTSRSSSTPGSLAMHDGNPALSSSGQGINTRSSGHNPMASIRLRETSDPQLLEMLRILREQLNSQPGLRVDVTEILAQLVVKCEQAGTEMATSSSSGESDGNVWSLSAKGLNMTRAKLERWAEIVAQGGAEAALKSLQVMGEDRTHSEHRGTPGTTRVGHDGASSLPDADMTPTQERMSINRMYDQEPVNTGRTTLGAGMAMPPEDPRAEAGRNDLLPGELLEGLGPYLWYYGVDEFGLTTML